MDFGVSISIKIHLYYIDEVFNSILNALMVVAFHGGIVVDAKV